MQGGPVNCVSTWTGEGEHFKQVKEGLMRSGLWQVSSCQ